jgi:hypothetical protein
MTDAMPDGYVVHLPPPKAQPAPDHLFGAAVTIAAEFSRSGHEQREWTCPRCHAVKVTVLPAGRREWRLSQNGPQLEWRAAPECKLVGTAA